MPRRGLLGFPQVMNLEAKLILRLVGGPADGFVFAVPATKVPRFVGVGVTTRYEREPSNGEVLIYRLVARAEH